MNLSLVYFLTCLENEKGESLTVYIATKQKCLQNIS